MSSKGLRIRFWKSAARKHRAPTEAYSAPVAAPTLLSSLEGRVVVKFAASGSPGFSIQTIGRLNRGLIDSAYNFEEAPRLGAGASGIVRLAVSKYTGLRFAVKSFYKFRAQKVRINLIRNEAQVLLRLDHPNIVRLIEIWEDDEAVHFVLENCSGGNLSSYFAHRSNRQLDELTCRVLFFQITSALLYLHSHNIVHRDVKLDHFLIDGIIPKPSLNNNPNREIFDVEEDGGLTEAANLKPSVVKTNKNNPSSAHSYPCVKCTDFGFSRVWTNKTSRPMKATCGSLPYTAPEVLLGHYTSQCDMWSLGIMAYILLTGGPPFYGSESQILKAILYDPIPLEPLNKCNLSRTGTDFIRHLLLRAPATRMTSKEAISHPWITGACPTSTIPISVRQILFYSFSAYAKSAYFRKTVLLLMAYSYPTSATKEVSFVRQVFAALDIHSEGSVSLQTMTEFMRVEGASEENAAGIVVGMNAFETDEFFFNDILAACLGTIVPIDEHAIRSTFWKFDKRRTGLVTVDNMRDLLGSVFRDKALEQMIREADKDGDKSIGFNEFRRIAVEIPK